MIHLLHEQIQRPPQPPLPPPPLTNQHHKKQNYLALTNVTIKTEQIKHNNFISNTMKSPTSFSKYMIPPPQRLFPYQEIPKRGEERKY